MPSPSPSFPFDLLEFRSSGAYRKLTLAAKGAYVTCLCLQWDHGSLPIDIESISLLFPSGDKSALYKVWPEIEGLFPVVGEGRQCAWLADARKKAERTADLRRGEGWRDGATKQSRRRERERSAGRPISNQVRLQVFEKDQWACVRCGVDANLTIDHITPLAHGGTNDFDNLQTLCRACNGRKKDKLEAPSGAN